MSVSAITDPHRLSAVQWRVINALYYTRGHETNALTLRGQQGAGWDQLVELDRAGLIAAGVGDLSINLTDLTRTFGSTRIQLTSLGLRYVMDNRTNRVIQVLGDRGRGVPAPVRDLKALAGADDDLLFKMGDAGLIQVGNGGAVALRAFRRLPPRLQIQLTSKGRQFYPVMGPTGGLLIG